MVLEYEPVMTFAIFKVQKKARSQAYTILFCLTISKNIILEMLGIA